METFGEFLKTIRKSKMTQRELAEKLNIGYPYISKLENDIDNTPSDLLLYKMAKILNIDEVELFQKAGRVPKDLQEYLLKNESILKILFKNNDEKENKSERNETKEEENMIKKLLITNNIILIINPATGEIEDANDSAEGFYKYSLKEFRNKRIIDLNILPEKVVREKMQEATLLNQNFFKFQHRLKSGDVKDIQVFSTPFSKNKQKYLYSTIIPH